jgi:hypothetical protein
MTIAWGRETPMEAAGIAIPRRGPEYTPCIQIGLVVVLGGIACLAGAVKLNAVLFVLHYGVGCAKISIQTVILSKVRDAPRLMDASVILAAISGIVYSWLLHSGMATTATLVLRAATVVSLADFVRLAVFVTWDLQSARGIKAFIVPQQDDDSTRVRNEGFYVTAFNLDEIKALWIKFSREEPGLKEKMYS